MGNLHDELRVKVLQPQAAINNEALKAVPQPPVLVQPVLKQVWLYLKDHPLKSAAQLAKSMPHLSKERINAALHDLNLRGMIVREKKGSDPYLCRVNPRMPHFEMWPMPKKGPKKKPVSVVEQKPAQLPAAEVHNVQESAPQLPAQAAPVQQAIPFDVEDLTIAQARVLYKQLQDLFGERL